ncbi:MAG: YciI family protein, partial [Eudoraea sp.]|nr:YciI family protein [Eudoraea sp.]
MQFLLTAYDGTDSGALDRRLSVREDHLENVAVLKSSGNFIWGGAILDDKGSMVGSVVVYEYDTRKELDRMLESEPYIL